MSREMTNFVAESCSKEHIDMEKSTKRTDTEVMTFRRGDNVATIATNGIMHVSQEFELLKEHQSLHGAIAYLEAKGYEISTDEFKVY